MDELEEALTRGGNLARRVPLWPRSDQCCFSRQPGCVFWHCLRNRKLQCTVRGALTTLTELALRVQCGSSIQFKYCTTSAEGYYYDGKKRKCVATSDEPPFLCNDGPNRFSKMYTCHVECVQARQPNKVCDVVPLFIPCQTRHLNHSWWFYDESKSRCVEWDMETGRCPHINDPDLEYQTEEACEETCASNPYHAVVFDCYVGDDEPCHIDYVKDPYFAFRGTDGRLQCLLADVDTLRGHLCLDEERWFKDRSTCAGTCMVSAAREVHDDPLPSPRPLRHNGNVSAEMCHEAEEVPHPEDH
ncbi:hypothetical protein HPB50_011937 [Hyalomma asiaticum]|uniref:Uncharacterized protein n=1 Tax=Hyalomma asiaticum TaxID=266040 RepID=A0ACB7SUR7_HYAAI|nr:hypothetical protein HPB50_011937 [Hyalomma asiaticum]